MQIIQVDSYQPQKDGLFVHGSLPCLAVHPSNRLLAFQSRQQQIIMKNTSTGRSIVLFNSEHPITSLVFTHRYLVASYRTGRELLIFSLKTEKLKSRVGGHHSEITQVSYSRQNELIASISQDLCMVHSQKTLAHLKSLKCVTSSFVDCAFGFDGGAFVCSFKDGSVGVWDPVQWEGKGQKNAAIIAKSPRVALGNGNVLAVYDDKKIWLADPSRQTLAFSELSKFWQGQLRQCLFLSYSLVINTDKGVFLVELAEVSNWKVKEVKRIQTMAAFISETDYRSTLVVLSQNLKRVLLLKVEESRKGLKKIEGSPLTNQGLVCAGGYSNEQGCFVHNGQVTANDYTGAELRVEPLYSGGYQQIPQTMSIGKLKQFLKKHHALPDRYRLLAYRCALKLPVCAAEFRALQRKGLHEGVEVLLSNYPLENGYLNQKMKDVMSLLGHWSPVLVCSDMIPPIVFPFVCLLGEDVFLCFQVLYRLFTGPLAFLFHEYPLANSSYLQNMWQILKGEDVQLTSHFQVNKISFTRLAWALLSSLFTTVFNREAFLAVADNVLVRSDEPHLVMFLCLGYLEFNRERFLSVKNEKEAQKICEEEQTIHLGKYLAVVNKLSDKYASQVRYQMRTEMNNGRYQELKVPLDAVKMHQNRGKILREELKKQKEAEIYREQMLVEMEKMAVNARRQAERQTLEQEAYRLHCQQQNAYSVKLREVDRGERVARLEAMVDQLSSAFRSQKEGNELFRCYVPAVQNIKNKSEDELQELEVKLTGLLSGVRPGNSLKPLVSQPTNVIKGKNCQGIQGAVGAKLASRMWEFDEISKKKQAALWQNRIGATNWH